jgi:penicillin amidase
VISPCGWGYRHYNYDDREMAQNHGPSYRQIVDFSDLEASLFLNPLGQSGLQLTEQYDDLITKWSSGEYLPMQTQKQHYADKIQKTVSVAPE